VPLPAIENWSDHPSLLYEAHFDEGVPNLFVRPGKRDRDWETTFDVSSLISAEPQPYHTKGIVNEFSDCACISVASGGAGAELSGALLLNAAIAETN
jgi:hypothetical protein